MYLLNFLVAGFKQENLQVSTQIVSTFTCMAIDQRQHRLYMYTRSSFDLFRIWSKVLGDHGRGLRLWCGGGGGRPGEGGGRNLRSRGACGGGMGGGAVDLA